MHQRVEVTRADYEARFGLKPDPSIIGACFYGPDCKTIIVEYVFLDAKDEIAILEDLFAL